MTSRFKSRVVWVAALLFVLVTAFGFAAGWQPLAASTQWTLAPVFDPTGLFGGYEKERTDGGYFVLIDERGTVLDQTSMYVYRGDEFIAENNIRYRVKTVDGDVARCVTIGPEEPVAAIEATESVPAAVFGGGAATNKPTVGIYHTHGGESYVPTQGVESVQGKGGISDVAKTLESKLNSMGIKAITDDTSHVPNDSGSYRRSRRTAANLMKQGANYLIDVHRDAAPASQYSARVNGKDVAKIRLVVGRQNPQESAALDLAKRIKDHLDKDHPGLSKGIFMGRGAYNQDLSPNAMLIEVGSEKTSLAQAKAGVDLFAEELPKIIGAGTAGATKVGTRTGQGGSWKALGWIIGAFIVGGAGYLLISSGSIKGAAGKLKQFGGSEWSSFFGRRGRGGGRDDDDSDSGGA
ncbi:MAG: stage II sporulation protein P [Firmicutes bacterium]|nr:stage II sporulation protein P [Bacillota bacterium]